MAVGLDEDVLAEGAELEQVEGAAARDAALAVEDAAAVARAAQHVEPDRAEHEDADRRQRDEQHSRDGHVERAFRARARDVLRCARSNACVPSR